jgi:hypothetical protein
MLRHANEEAPFIVRMLNETPVMSISYNGVVCVSGQPVLVSVDEKALRKKRGRKPTLRDIKIAGEAQLREQLNDYHRQVYDLWKGIYETAVHGEAWGPFQVRAQCDDVWSEVAVDIVLALPEGDEESMLMANECFEEVQDHRKGPALISYTDEYGRFLTDDAVAEGAIPEAYERFRRYSWNAVFDPTVDDTVVAMRMVLKELRAEGLLRCVVYRSSREGQPIHGIVL